MNNGDFSYYLNEEVRKKEKESTPSEIIISKYEELHDTLYNKMVELANLHNITEDDYEDEDRYEEVKKLFPDFGEVCNDYWNLYFEERNYTENLQSKKGATYNFPIIEQFFEDAKNSIPNIILEGVIYEISQETVSKTYEKAKELKLFGETEDC